MQQHAHSATNAAIICIESIFCFVVNTFVYYYCSSRYNLFWKNLYINN